MRPGLCLSQKQACRRHPPRTFPAHSSCTLYPHTVPPHCTRTQFPRTVPAHIHAHPDAHKGTRRAGTPERVHKHAQAHLPKRVHKHAQAHLPERVHKHAQASVCSHATDSPPSPQNTHTNVSLHMPACASRSPWCAPKHTHTHTHTQRGTA